MWDTGTRDAGFLGAGRPALHRTPAVLLTTVIHRSTYCSDAQQGHVRPLAGHGETRCPRRLYCKTPSRVALNSAPWPGPDRCQAAGPRWGLGAAAGTEPVEGGVAVAAYSPTHNGGGAHAPAHAPVVLDDAVLPTPLLPRPSLDQQAASGAARCCAALEFPAYIQCATCPPRLSAGRPTRPTSRRGRYTTFLSAALSATSLSRSDSSLP